MSASVVQEEEEVRKEYRLLNEALSRVSAVLSPIPSHVP